MNRKLFKAIFGEEFKQEPYKMANHGPWIPVKGAGKMYCQSCGLVRLNNDATRGVLIKGVTTHYTHNTNQL